MAHSLVFKPIPHEDTNITPFQTFKKWTSNHTNFSSSFGINIRRGTLDEDWKKYDYAHGFMTALPNPDGTDQKTIWYHINGMYYKEGKTNLDIEYSEYMIRNLHATASYVQLPQQYFGEGIKLGSVRITNGSNVVLRDDTCGNLYDTTINTGSMVSSDHLKGYWGFNDKFKYTRQHYKYEAGTAYNYLPYDHLSYINTHFTPGIKTTGAYVKPSGLKATLDGTGCLYIDDAKEFNFKNNENFAISLWVQLPTTQTQITGSYNSIVSKNGDIKTIEINKRTQLQKFVYEPYTKQKFPFDIKIGNHTGADNGKIVVSRSDVKRTPTIKSVSTLNNNQQHHIVFNKNGSTLELWINGIKEGFTTDTTIDNTHNSAILTFGSNGYNRGGLVGSLDEIRIYDKALTKKQIESLHNNDYNAGTAYNTPIVGNVFYPQGTMVISDPRPKYHNVLLGNNFDYTSNANDNFTMEYRSTLTMYENEIICRVAPGEFNFTSNPTIRHYNDMNSPTVKGFVTGSDWHPYVTTIGLFDEYGRMLAVGKTAQAIPMRDDVETTFVVRYDE